MKAMIAGFAAMAVITVAAWFLLNERVPYTEGQRTAGDSVRLD